MFPFFKDSKPSGEYFDPGYDCLDILNKNTKAKDGYYWVDFHRSKPIKVISNHAFPDITGN